MTAKKGQAGPIDPYLMVVLPRRFRAIVAEMENTLQRSARSGVLAICKDAACGILSRDCRIIDLGKGSQVLALSNGLVAEPMLDYFDDIQPGDCFLNNSPYHGNTHHADYSYIVPVFYHGEHVFTAVSRGHQADIGNSAPSMYMVFVKDLYEEGALNFPCVRVQRNYQDVEDVIRMCRMRIRIPEQWYGDYLAGVGSARIAERRLIELCDKYGVETIKSFVEQWQDLGRRSAAAEIGKLPKVTLEGETRFDPVPGHAPEGVPIRAIMSVDPEAGEVTFDLTGNVDAMNWGLNMSTATMKTACIAGTFYNLSPTIPHNQGAFDCVKIISREGCIVGREKHPFSCSRATGSLAHRLVNLVQSMFARVSPRMGLAEGAVSTGPGSAVISGTDFRYDNRPYINQLFAGTGGGPGMYGHDGWPRYVSPMGAAGMLDCESTEMDELKYPILFQWREREPDTGGAGQWDGAPSMCLIARPRKDPNTWIYFMDGKAFPPKGVVGGHSGRQSAAWKIDESGKRVELPSFTPGVVINPTESIGGLWPGGGGYGDPLDQDPERVRWKARNDLISLERAKSIYGVVLDTEPEEYRVDYEATRKFRTRLKERGKNTK